MKQRSLAAYTSVPCHAALLFFAFTLLMTISLVGCNSVPQPPSGPQGSSAANWSNDFLRAESGTIWVVNGTWTANGSIIFQNRQFSPEQFRKMLTERGISTNTPISILQEPGVTAPGIEWQRFYEAGYKYTRFLSLPKRYW